MAGHMHRYNTAKKASPGQELLRSSERRSRQNKFQPGSTEHSHTSESAFSKKKTSLIQSEARNVNSKHKTWQSTNSAYKSHSSKVNSPQKGRQQRKVAVIKFEATSKQQNPGKDRYSNLIQKTSSTTSSRGKGYPPRAIEGYRTAYHTQSRAKEREKLGSDSKQQRKTGSPLENKKRLIADQINQLKKKASKTKISNRYGEEGHQITEDINDSQCSRESGSSRIHDKDGKKYLDTDESLVRVDEGGDDDDYGNDVVMEELLQSKEMLEQNHQQQFSIVPVDYVNLSAVSDDEDDINEHTNYEDTHPQRLNTTLPKKNSLSFKKSSIIQNHHSNQDPKSDIHRHKPNKMSYPMTKTKAAPAPFETHPPHQPPTDDPPEYSATPKKLYDALLLAQPDGFKGPTPIHSHHDSGSSQHSSMVANSPQSDIGKKASEKGALSGVKSQKHTSGKKSLGGVSVKSKQSPTRKSKLTATQSKEKSAGKMSKGRSSLGSVKSITSTKSRKSKASYFDKNRKSQFSPKNKKLSPQKDGKSSKRRFNAIGSQDKLSIGGQTSSRNEKDSLEGSPYKDPKPETPIKSLDSTPEQTKRGSFRKPGEDDQFNDYGQKFGEELNPLRDSCTLSFFGDTDEARQSSVGDDHHTHNGPNLLKYQIRNILPQFGGLQKKERSKFRNKVVIQRKGKSMTIHSQVPVQRYVLMTKFNEYLNRTEFQLPPTQDYDGYYYTGKCFRELNKYAKVILKRKSSGGGSTGSSEEPILDFELKDAFDNDYAKMFKKGQFTQGEESKKSSIVETIGGKGGSESTSSDVSVESGEDDKLSPQQQFVIETLQSLQYVNQIDKPSDAEFKSMNKYVTLPPPKNHKIKKLAVFDMDETLIHCLEDSLKDKLNPSKKLISNMEVNIRPWARECLQAVSQWYQVVTFTAGSQKYADNILDEFDPGKTLIEKRFYRHHCHNTSDGMHIKDLRIFEKCYDMKDIILIDNAVFSYAFQINNGVPMQPFYNDKDDIEMIHMTKYLERLAQFDDVRPQIQATFIINEMKNPKLVEIVEGIVEYRVEEMSEDDLKMLLELEGSSGTPKKTKKVKSSDSSKKRPTPNKVMEYEPEVPTTEVPHKPQTQPIGRPSDVDIIQFDQPQNEIFEVVDVKDEETKSHHSDEDRQDSSFLTPPDSIVEEVVVEEAQEMRDTVDDHVQVVEVEDEDKWNNYYEIVGERVINTAKKTKLTSTVLHRPSHNQNQKAQPRSSHLQMTIIQ